jgi:hypothetical protein
MNSWQAGQDGRVGQKTEDRRPNVGEGFPMNRDVRFTAVLTWLLMLITS